MTAPRSRVAQVCQLLNAEAARYLMVGAIAMQLWGTTRATRDIDILIDPTLEIAVFTVDGVAVPTVSMFTGAFKGSRGIKGSESLKRVSTTLTP